MRFPTIALPRIASASAVLLLTAGLLGACGGGDEPSDTASASKSAGTDAKPASELTQDTFASTIATAMRESGSTHVTMTGSLSGQELKAEGDQVIGQKADDSQVSLVMDVAGQSFDMRLLDQVVYFNLGSLSENKFVEIDLTDTSNPMVAQFGGLANQADVSKQFETFGDAITAFEKAGKVETIDGVDAQPYTVTVDAKKLAAAQGQEAVAGMPATFDYTFFVGPDNLPRRLIAGVSGQEVTLEYSKWGAEVTVEKPAASEITDLDLAQLGASAG